MCLTTLVNLMRPSCRTCVNKVVLEEKVLCQAYTTWHEPETHCPFYKNLFSIKT